MTGFSNTSRTQFRYAVETTQNTAPAIAFQNITAKSGGMEANITYVTSLGIRTDRTVQDQILTSEVPAGNIAFELAYGVADPLIAATLQDASTWNLPTNFSTVSCSTSSGSSNTLFGITGSSTSIPVNALLLSSGFATATDNTLSVVTAATTGGIITCTTSAGGVVTDAGSASSVIKVVGVQASSNGAISIATSGVVSNSSGINFLDFGLHANQVIKVGGSAAANKSLTSANNDFARITSISSVLIALDNTPTGWTTDASSSVSLRVLWGDRIANGITRTSFTIEEDHPDISFCRDFTGQYPDQMTLKMTPAQILEGTFAFKGMGLTLGTSSLTTGAAITAPSNPIMNAVTSITRINEAGVAAGKMSDGTLTVKNNLGDVLALGTLGNADVRDGQFNCEFDFSMYMSSTQGQSIYTKAAAGTGSKLWFVLKDASGNAYSIDLPAGRFTAPTTPVTGINQDYKGTFKFATYYDTTSSYQLMINRIPNYNA